ncbi:3-hydroxyacyl-CoA dehydrogenase/enoyl-CoA hydratase family protein [Halalkalibacter alkaliphilus]|uniref:enoyl-CoA hydratase n=1 Tax=Halalkalibacter alkaliphilus TaxID=2917993 RepID=A0A9X2CUW7_9BACI|nr:3-hydroxyacyl-CoA dehydrogenase/enoyl-CoA hydratase family protein [Halalkalibacter alkaliphilus]MCL7748714.1 3-hydroxyacyl-CoA dehydrogenase NAD-binding domain-containing protein [Halalkalibacter alkaliphilus]
MKMTNSLKVGVVGAGNMGSGIAQKMAQEGLHVTLVDVTEEQVQRGISIIEKMLNEGIERRIFSEKEVSDTLARVQATSDYEALKDADLIVEAVFEDEKVKGDLFAKLDKICDEKTIFATNTSGIYIRDLAKYTNRPEKFIGMHYFYHPAKNRLVEVIPHEGTSKETIETTLFIGKLHNKTCIVVKDSPGFAVNRYFSTFLTESIYLLDQGVANTATIDAAAKQGFEIGMGPFELMNVTGIPIALHVSEYMGQEVSEFYSPADILRRQVELKQDWDLSGEIDETKFQTINRHLYATIFGVAGAQVDEGVASIEDTDRGAKIGLRWSLGPFELINKVGVQEACQMVKELYTSRPGFHFPEVLKKQAEKGLPFEFKYVDLEVKNDIAYITINRPEAMNALNPVVVNQLEKAFEEAEKDPKVKGIAIQGAGKAFVAGADIKHFIECIQTNQIEENVAFTRKGHELFRRFEMSEKLTIAVLDGLSLGGGSELALACQAIVATHQGSMGFPESGLGIYPGLGGMLRTNHHIGKELTKYYTFTGKTIPAKVLKELGIVTELVDMKDTEAAIEKIVANGKFNKYGEREIPASFEEFKKAFSDENVERMLNGEKPEGVRNELAEKALKVLSNKGLIALETMNELINKQTDLSIDEGIELELDGLVPIFKTEDALTGLIAVTKGKHPVFKTKLVGRA